MKYFKLKQIQNPQKLLSFQTTPKNLKTDRKFFPAPFLPLLVIIWGRMSTQIFQPKDISCCPFQVILQNCWPPGNKQLLAGQQLAIRGGQDSDLVLKAGWFPLHELF